jgi:hypothetical protein
MAEKSRNYLSARTTSGGVTSPALMECREMLYDRRRANVSGGCDITIDAKFAVQNPAI